MSRRLVRVSKGKMFPGSLANRSPIVRATPVKGNNANDKATMLKKRLIYFAPYCFFTSGSHFRISEMRVAWLGCELMNSGGS